jgi:hypothetical protein
MKEGAFKCPAIMTSESKFPAIIELELIIPFRFTNTCFINLSAPTLGAYRCKIISSVEFIPWSLYSDIYI